MRSLGPTLLSSLLLGPWTLAPRASAGPEAPPQAAARPVTTPKEFFGFNMGDDYCLANYQQLVGYWNHLEHSTDRVRVLDIGVTEEERRQLVAVVSSPANLRQLDRYREVSRRLARADGVGRAEAAKLAAEGKAVVWIDAGIHATETLCPQAMIETVYQLVAGEDEETRRVLDDVIILFVHANPDGHDLVADWYMREPDPKKRTLAGLPRLYQKYVGHDNNRDFYANTQAETRNLNRLMYRDWFPQVMYNHHQTGPAGTVLFCSPFRDPFNYFFDPLVVNGIESVGAAMIQRFLVEGKPGATVRSGGPYSTWFNGGIRTSTSFHNIIGVMSETIGGPAPTRIPLVTAKILPKGDYLAPIPPQEWHFRQSVDYSVTANKALLDYASRHRQQLLFNIWLMGHNATERGDRDSWTITPKLVAAATPPTPAADDGGRGRGNRGGDGGAAEFGRLFRDPARRDPRGFIVPADQVDFPTATKFINTLLGTGVRVHRATADFTVAGKRYPKGSYVVKSAQAFRAQVLDLFEPQDHPNDFAYPGGSPVRPYDAAGYTPAFQMAVQFDRILDGFEAPLEEIPEESIAPPPARVSGGEEVAGFFLDPRLNDSFRAVNRLQKAGEEVRRLRQPAEIAGVARPAGAFFIPRRATTRPLLEAIAAEFGTPFEGSPAAPGPEAVVLKTPRIGLWDRQGGSIPSGWTRWLLERFEFPFRVTYAPELDEGRLHEKFDVLILVDGAYGARGDRPEEGEAGNGNDRPAAGPSRTVTAATLPHLKAFLEEGGTVLAIGGSTGLGRELGLRLANHLADADAEGRERSLSPDKFYVPPSVLRMRVDPTDPLAWGLADEVDVMFASSPTFRLPADAPPEGVRRVGWFDTKAPLRSGWAWGQERLEGGTAIIDAQVGKGRLALFGPQVLYRGQAHGTFKFVFNGIVQSALAE